MVLNYLRDGNSITSLDALNMFGCFRLAAVIFNLREDSNPIFTEMVKDPKTKKTYARYYMTEDSGICQACHKELSNNGRCYYCEKIEYDPDK